MALCLCVCVSRISKNIPTTKDVEPLLEIDGDARSFEVFLSSRTPVLASRDIKTFLPCTINLDPKLREIIAGELTPESALSLLTVKKTKTNMAIYSFISLHKSVHLPLYP